MFENGDDDYYDPYAFQYDTPYDPDRQQFLLIPDPVKNFLLFFQQAVSEGNLYNIQTIYESGFDDMTDKWFRNRSWPSSDDVKDVVGNDQIFLTLYKELYYRHLYASVTGGPNIKQRIDSYYNYTALFNYILTPEDEPVMLELPNLWLWDIIDEFVYQFQSFAIYRSRRSTKTEEELKTLDGSTCWYIQSVLNVLYALVEKSRINQQLAAYNNLKDGDEVYEIAGRFGNQPLYKFLGFFALVGLCRVSCLIGDYRTTISVIENIELNKKGMSWSPDVPSCQITMYYYVGFAYMMMRRYQDATRCFVNILLYIQRTKNIFHVRSYQNDMISKQTEQMYHLLTICLCMYPSNIDEAIFTQLNEKVGDKLTKIQRGDNPEEELETLFSYGCPKFLSPSVSTIEERMDNHRDMYQLQLKVFLDEVRQQNTIGIIRSYLKLYSSLPVSKLAKFLAVTEDELQLHLMAFKHKMSSLVWCGQSSSLGGQFKCESEIDFYIDDDMIHIADTKVAAKYGDYFILQIQKCDEIFKKLKAIQ